MTRFSILFPILILVLYVFPFAVSAVEVAPRITDREIIESLAELKAGQKAMDKRFDSMDKRLDSFEKRFDFLENLMLILISSVLGLVAFIIWDRKTALRPLEQRLERLESDLRHDLELQSPEGSRLTRLIHVLREMAKKDQPLAEILKSFSLL